MCYFLTVRPESRYGDYWMAGLLDGRTVRNEAYFIG